jgi:type I restriction enzyme S subunit
MTEKMQNHSTGIRNLKLKEYKEINVPIPPLPEQQRIVDILDQSFAAIDQAIENTEKNISESQNLFDNYLDNIFYNNDHWKTKKLGDICFITDGTHYSPKNNQFGEYKYITAKNIKPFELDLSNITFISKEDHEKIYLRCPVKKGDILYIKDGATTGNAAINTIDEEFSLLSSVALIKPVDFINNDFLVYYMNSNVGRKNFLGKIGGVAITRLTIEKLKNIFISFPSVDQQENYVQKFKKLRSEIEELKRIYSSKLLLLQELKQSILHKAFNGDL